MKVKIVFDNDKDKELINLVNFSTPFFVEFIDARTKNGKSSAYKVKSEFGARMNPFVVVYNDEDKLESVFWSENQNACQSFVTVYKDYESKNKET